MSLVDATFRGPGRAQAAIEHSFAGPVTAEDVARLAAPRGVKPNMPSRMRERHHTLAQAVAAGFTNTEAADMTGYDPTYISNMRTNPAFILLVNDYKKETARGRVDVKDRMLSTLRETIDLIQDKLESQGEDIPLETLTEISKTLADRTGYAPVSKTQSTVVTLDLSEAMRRAREVRERPVVVEGRLANAR